MIRAAENTPELDPRAMARMRAVARWAAVIAAAIAAVGLVSFPLELPWLRSLGKPVEIQPNAAAGILLAALALLVRGYGRWGGLVARLLAAVVAALGLATVLEHATGIDLGIDRLLYPGIPLTPGATSPGRMGPPSALNLGLAGLVLLLLGARRRRARSLAHVLALALLLVPLVGVVGHAYGVSPLFDAPGVTTISFPAALALVAIDLGLLCARPDTGFAANIVSTGAGSALARRMLVYTLAVPIVLGGVALAVSGAGPSGAIAISILVVALSLVFAMLVLRDAVAIDRMDAAKLRAQQERAASREELARALRREQEARAHAETASRAKDQFLATLSHELRTPLNAILGWAGLLRDAAGDPDRLARGLGVIERNGRALAQLVADLLDMSRIAAGKMEVARSDVDLLAVVDEAVESLRAAACAKGVALSRAPAPDVPRVIGDRARLQQVAWNLVSNAVKFTPPGGSVEVRLGHVEALAVLEVTDTGIGMPPQSLTEVFDPFYQVDASSIRRQGGLGLGLAISRQLVALHGGTIQAESAGPGSGSCFRVRLPAVARPPAVARTPVPERPELAGARVLVVDDEADSREVLLQLLGTWGARAAGAASAQEALEAIARERPDLVVSDIAMPGEDGFALLRELRRAEAARGARRVPIAALTAFARPEDRQRTLAAGFDAHLAKPVDAATLLATIAGLVRAAREGAARPATADALAAG